MAKRLYVGNLPLSVAEAELHEIFSEIGAVESVRLIVDRHTGESKGFGYVCMSSDELSEQAIERMNGTQLVGRTLKVVEAEPYENRPSAQRRRAPGYHHHHRRHAPRWQN